MLQNDPADAWDLHRVAGGQRLPPGVQDGLDDLLRFSHGESFLTKRKHQGMRFSQHYSLALVFRPIISNNDFDFVFDLTEVLHGSPKVQADGVVCLFHGFL